MLEAADADAMGLIKDDELVGAGGKDVAAGGV